MKVFVRESAQDDLDRLFAWIARDNPVAAAQMVAQIRDRINLLEIDSLAHMGPGTRELIEYPYIIVYEVQESRGEVDVLSVMHGAQDRLYMGHKIDREGDEPRFKRRAS
jgi:toxin ParE1/3/4